MGVMEIDMHISEDVFGDDVKLLRWGYGEWVEEADDVLYFDRGFRCLAHRVGIWEGPNKDHLFGGHLCGYIMIPEGHPWHGKHYDTIECEVHGGLTFSEEIEYKDLIKMPFKVTGYWIGFDCAHYNDIIPSSKLLHEKMAQELRANFPTARSSIFEPTYKNIEFVKGEIKRMVDQAIETIKGASNG